MTGFLAANEQMGMQYRDVWSTAYINDLPDSAFLYIEPGGSKDPDGKTVPRSLRHFPVKDANGKPDAAHINNAIARINQADIPGAAKEAAMRKAKAMSAAHPDIGSGKTSSYEGSAGSGRARTDVVICRSFDVDLMLRAGGDGRTLIGRAVPYGQTIDMPDGSGRERFVSGAFARHLDNPGHIKLHASHEGRKTDFAVGKTVSLEDRPDGLHGAWELYNTSGGNDALELVRTGEVTGLSVGFKLIPNGTRYGPDGVFERTAVHLDHVALTTEPAYSEAKVLAVRHLEAGLVSGLRTAQARHHLLLDRLRG